MSEEDKKEMKRMLYDAHPALVRLSELLNEDLEKSVTDMSKQDNYTMPAWSAYQADKLGEQRAIRKILGMIDIEDK